jgi:hypothetical protein
LVILLVIYFQGDFLLLSLEFGRYLKRCRAAGATAGVFGRLLHFVRMTRAVDAGAATQPASASAKGAQP